MDNTKNRSDRHATIGVASGEVYIRRNFCEILRSTPSRRNIRCHAGREVQNLIVDSKLTANKYIKQIENDLNSIH
jgi:hypothetical protein